MWPSPPISTGTGPGCTSGAGASREIAVLEAVLDEALPDAGGGGSPRCVGGRSRGYLIGIPSPSCQRDRTMLFGKKPSIGSEDVVAHRLFWTTRQVPHIRARECICPPRGC
jgi:hypothetical protein